MKEHSQYFLKKQQLKKEYDEKIQALKEEIHRKKMEKLLEMEKEKLEKKLEKKMNKKIEAEKKFKEKVRKRYANIKTDSESYKKYLETQKKYREKYKIIRKEKQLNDLLEKIGDEEYRILTFKEKNLYVTSSGRFFRETGREIFGTKHPSGYVAVGFAGMTKSAHRLVWEAFHGEIPSGMEIDHINTNKQDNSISNLRIATHKDNCNNPLSIENYTKHNKEANRDYLRKKVYQYTIDGELVKEWNSAMECAHNGYTYKCVLDCCCGRQHTHKNFLWSHEKYTS